MQLSALQSGRRLAHGALLTRHGDCPGHAIGKATDTRFVKTVWLPTTVRTHAVSEMSEALSEPTGTAES